ncbi:E3 ubiquitin-protein ligase Midline-1-like [Branchiostoma floridae]|uniref:E3 ubiquitin-protein ligase Midline-1-like n=1 Tax=Branchiostoma floridae TaxID=7739 RepID=A0A9J7KI94_BRAFL|nr:E3 ubiquitin-protein ligase Midline-1-like [Branchiostoma floridae]
MYSMSRGEGQVLPCQICEEEPPSPAVKLCVQCNVKYCETCLSNYHPRKGVFARHQLVEPTAEKKTVMCSEHDDEKVNLVCMVCEVPICHLCKLVGEHKEHDVAALSTQYNVKKEHLGSNVLKLKSWMSSLETFINDLDKMKQQVKNGGEQMRVKINSAMDELVSILQERRDVMLEKSRDMEKEKMDRLEQEDTKRKDELKTCKAVTSYADEVAKETDQACFLQAVKATNDRVTKTTPTKGHLKLPCDGEFPSPDFSSVAEVLKKLCVTQAPGQSKFLDHTIDGTNIVLSWEDVKSANVFVGPIPRHELQWQKEDFKEDDGDKWVTVSDIQESRYNLALPKESCAVVCQVRGFRGSAVSRVYGPWSEPLRLKIDCLKQITTNDCNISVSSTYSNTTSSHLLDGRDDTCWCSDQEGGKHWIRLEMKKNISSVQSLALKLVPKQAGHLWDASCRPPHVAVYGGNSLGDLSLVWEVNIGDNDDDVTLLRNLDKVYRCFELKIDQAKGTRSYRGGPRYIVCQLKASGIVVTKM